MCRNIRRLYNFEPPVTDEEIRSASLQFVRKVSGLSKPSKKNEEFFLTAVDEIAAATARLLRSLETSAPPRNREEEAAKMVARYRSERVIRKQTGPFLKDSSQEEAGPPGTRSRSEAIRN